MSTYVAIGYRGRQSLLLTQNYNFRLPILVKFARISLLFMVQQRKLLEIGLFTKILALKVKKMPKFDKNWLFWDFDRFLTIFRHQVNRKSPNFAQLYRILSSSGNFWSLPLSTLCQTSQGRAAALTALILPTYQPPSANAHARPS